VVVKTRTGGTAKRKETFACYTENVLGIFIVH